MNTKIKHKSSFFIDSSFPKGAASRSVPFGKKLAVASLSHIGYDIFGKPRLYAPQPQCLPSLQQTRNTLILLFATYHEIDLRLSLSIVTVLRRINTDSPSGVGTRISLTFQIPRISSFFSPYSDSVYFKNSLAQTDLIQKYNYFTQYVPSC